MKDLDFVFKPDACIYSISLKTYLGCVGETRVLFGLAVEVESKEGNNRQSATDDTLTN